MTRIILDYPCAFLNQHNTSGQKSPFHQENLPARLQNPLNSHSTPRPDHRRMNLTSNVLETRFKQHTKFFNQPWPTTNHLDTASSGFSTQKSTLEQSMINKIKSTLVLSSLLLLTFAPSIASAAASPDPYADETPAQRDAPAFIIPRPRIGTTAVPR